MCFKALVACLYKAFKLFKKHMQIRKMTNVGFFDADCPDVQERVVHIIESKNWKIRYENHARADWIRRNTKHNFALGV